LVGVNDGIVSKSLKRIVDRPRPHQAVADLRLLELQKAKPRLLAVAKPLKVKYSRVATGDVEGRSFPSSHTMNTLAVAIAGAAFLGWRAWWLFLVAGIVSYSRVYTGSHWPSDVATSLFLGAGCSLLILALLELAWRKRGAFVLPKIHAQHPALFRS
jgi:undecaprenyl-diphosphatase